MATFQDVIKGIPGLTNYYPLHKDPKDIIGGLGGSIHGNVTFDGKHAHFDGKSSIELPDSATFSCASTPSKALTIIVFQIVDDWTRQSSNGEYVHWMGKGQPNQYEWGFRYYVDGGGGEAPSRPRRTSFYHWNPAGNLGAGSFFQDPDAAGKERVIGAQVWGNSKNGGSTQMWKDGVVRDTDLLSGYSINPVDTPSHVFLGTRGDNSGFLVGRLRRVAFFNRQLTPYEMKTIYDARDFEEDGPAVPAPPVIDLTPEIAAIKVKAAELRTIATDLDTIAASIEDEVK